MVKTARSHEHCLHMVSACDGDRQTDGRTDRGRTSIAERDKDGPRGRKAVVQTWRLRCHAVRCDPRYRLSRQQMFELVNLSSRYKIILLFHAFATQADAGPNSFIDVINLQLFDEMFIFSSKSRCCSGTFTNVIFTSLLKRIFKENTNHCPICKVSILSAILSESFI